MWRRVTVTWTGQRPHIVPPHTHTHRHTHTHSLNLLSVFSFSLAAVPSFFRRVSPEAEPMLTFRRNFSFVGEVAKVTAISRLLDPFTYSKT